MATAPLMELPPGATWTKAQRDADKAARARAARAAAPHQPWCLRCDRAVELVTFRVAEGSGRMEVAARCHGVEVAAVVSFQAAAQGAIGVLGAELFGDGLA